MGPVGRLELLHIDVLPHKDKENSKWQESRPGDDQLSLHIAVRGNNSVALGGTEGERLLDFDGAKDLGGPVLVRISEVSNYYLS